jgi:hypothetical protein
MLATHDDPQAAAEFALSDLLAEIEAQPQPEDDR